MHLAGFSSTDSSLRDTNICSIMPGKGIHLAMTNSTITPLQRSGGWRLIGCDGSGPSGRRCSAAALLPPEPRRRGVGARRDDALGVGDRGCEQLPRRRRLLPRVAREDLPRRAPAVRQERARRRDHAHERARAAGRARRDRRPRPPARARPARPGHRERKALRRDRPRERDRGLTVVGEQIQRPVGRPGETPELVDRASRWSRPAQHRIRGASERVDKPSARAGAITKMWSRAARRARPPASATSTR